MIKNVYISEKLYTLINDIAAVNNHEQMMVFGGNTIGNTIVVSSNSFVHYGKDNLITNNDSSVKVSLKQLQISIEKIKKMGNDTFFMTHSHPCKSNRIEFMYGDLSDEDEVNSLIIRRLCDKFDVDYYDGITTGKRLYFWSTKDNTKAPQLMNCYVDNVAVDYNYFTSVTENIEHILK